LRRITVMLAPEFLRELDKLRRELGRGGVDIPLSAVLRAVAARGLESFRNQQEARP
jgi:hypothetical protein